ncbi:hypothetical protein M231_04459 [Tremella mesenterica]|uniref:Uncharacterized protein n=1 Tax=Tremella mesenterica TaxID=5217 RepID=A0A4Q1BKQ9_TREME|nr:hypothetical protein M231_04459 [Tremella mesenterica]
MKFDLDCLDAEYHKAKLEKEVIHSLLEKSSLNRHDLGEDSVMKLLSLVVPNVKTETSTSTNADRVSTRSDNQIRRTTIPNEWDPEMETELQLARTSMLGRIVLVYRRDKIEELATKTRASWGALLDCIIKKQIETSDTARKLAEDFQGRA